MIVSYENLRGVRLGRLLLSATWRSGAGYGYGRTVVRGSTVYALLVWRIAFAATIAEMT